jgi:ubiquitin C-terminal hydrolase
LWTPDVTITPIGLAKALQGAAKNTMYMNEQNDIQEFFSLMIDKINEQLASSTKGQVTKGTSILHETKSQLPPASSCLPPILTDKLDEAWLTSVGKDFSPVIPLFYGQSLTQMACGNALCQKIHHTYQPFMPLFLEIPPTPPNTSVSFNECLDYTFRQELMNIWKCDKCNQTSDSIKTCKLYRMPLILCISIKRFTFDMQKNNTNIHVPVELNLGNFILVCKRPGDFLLP